MKKLGLSLLVVTLACSAASAQKRSSRNKPDAPAAAQKSPAAPAFKSLPLGSSIPMEGFMMIATDGRPTTLAQAKTAKGLVVMFSCNTCPYVIKAQARTHEAQDLSKEMGIGMVIVNSNEAQRAGDDAPGHMREYAEIQKYRVPYVRDDNSTVANAFGATRTPEVFLFDGNSKLVYKGALEDNPAEPEKSTTFYLADALRAVSAAKPVKAAETKSIGCSIKRVEM